MIPDLNQAVWQPPATLTERDSFKPANDFFALGRELLANRSRLSSAVSIPIPRTRQIRVGVGIHLLLLNALQQEVRATASGQSRTTAPGGNSGACAARTAHGTISIRWRLNTAPPDIGIYIAYVE